MPAIEVKKRRSVLGVTAAFALGSILTTAALALLLSVGKSSYTAPVDWLHVATHLVSYAVVFGLTVDAIRFVARLLWPRTANFAPSLTDIVNMELS